MTVVQIIAPPRPTAIRRTLRPPWRSPDDQPAWARPVLLMIAVKAAIIYAWGINSVPLNGYYAPAVKTMSGSWKAFFYGGYDPSGSITLDKLPGAFMVQALSARVFGFHTWSLILPQVIAAVASVLLLYRVVRRWQGPLAGLLAAAFLAATPMLAALARSQISDGILVLLLILAAEAWQRAVTTGRLRLLLLSGLWVGLAFQTKMVQAWGVLPALAIGYLVAAPITMRRRLAHVGLAGLVAIGVSLWQVALFWLTPASARPYADGSTNNSLFSTVFEYNLFSRFGAGGDGSVQFGTGAGAAGSGSGGWGYMFGDQVAPQVGWLYPLAAAGLLLGLAGPLLRGLALVPPNFSDPTDAAVCTTARSRMACTLMWGLWFAMHALAFSGGQVAHSFYVVAVAPAVVALAASGLATLWQLYLCDGWARWLLPAVLGPSVGWAIHLCVHASGFRSWLIPVLATAGATAMVLLVVGGLTGGAARSATGEERPRMRWWSMRLVAGGGVLALAAVLIAPSVWAASTVDSRYAGSPVGPAAGPDHGFGSGARPAMNAPAQAGASGQGHGSGPGAAGRSGPQAAGDATGMNASAGDATGMNASAGGATGVNASAGGASPFAGGIPTNLFGGGNGRGSGVEPNAQIKELVAFLNTHQHGERYLAAAQSSIQTGQLILAGAGVLPIGGFSGQVPFPTLNRFVGHVTGGELRYVLLGGVRPSATGPAGDAPIRDWVIAHCVLVTPGAYGGNTDPSQAAFDQSLYDCRTTG